MNQLETIINNSFQDVLRSKLDPRYHLFFDSHNWWKDTYKEWTTYDFNPHKDYAYDSSTNVDSIQPVDECKHSVKKTITPKHLHEIYQKITNPKTTDFKTVRKYLNLLYNYNLPSTVPDLKHSTELNKDRDISIIIVGAGPVGLYTALYLRSLYHKYNSLNIKANILLVDNRIYKEGVKLPYSRVTMFGFNINYIQPFINQINCWKNKNINDVIQFDYINILENLLYLIAFNKNIPMYFTKKLETYDSVVEFANKYNYKYIFDCTGGRLKPTFKPSFSWDKYKFKSGKYEIKDVDNMYRLHEDDKVYKRTVLVLQIFDKNMKQYTTGNQFGFVTNSEDRDLTKLFRNKCLHVDDYIKLSKHFKDNRLRNLYPNILNSKVKNIKYVKITAFNVNAYHVKQAAKLINDRLMYVGLGNSLGLSEFGIYFGLEKGMFFAKYVCNLLSAVRYM